MLLIDIETRQSMRALSSSQQGALENEYTDDSYYDILGNLCVNHAEYTDAIEYLKSINLYP